ncbi:hypothetical protein HZA96_06795 [Candidatus Woesearchaeota archaeon]|nr:hypothetical protein [Candidatus Woesearchaeota archaeon]
MDVKYSLQMKLFGLDTPDKMNAFCRQIYGPAIKVHDEMDIVKVISDQHFFSEGSIANLEIDELEKRLGFLDNNGNDPNYYTPADDSIIWGNSGLWLLHILLRHPFTKKETINYVQQGIKELFENEDLSKRIVETYEKYQSEISEIKGFKKNNFYIKTCSDFILNPGFVPYDSHYSISLKLLEPYFGLMDSLISLLDQASAESLRDISAELKTLMQHYTVRAIRKILNVETTHTFVTRKVKDNQYIHSYEEIFYQIENGDLIRTRDTIDDSGDSKYSINQLLLAAINRLFHKEIQLQSPVLTIQPKTSFIFLDSFLGYINGMANYTRKLYTENNVKYCFPEMVDGKISIEGAIHPFLLDRKGKKVPNNILFNSTTSLYVIAGLNNGGKTTYLKTIGLLMLLAQMGAPIPSKNGVIAPIDHIYTLLNEKDSVHKGKGKLVVDIDKIKYIIENVTDSDLLLLDEPFGHTSEGDSLDISLNVINALQKIGIPTVYTTNIHKIQAAIDDEKELNYSKCLNLKVDVKEINGNAPVFTYKIVKGRADLSYGMQIAGKRLSLDDILKKRGIS